MARLYVYAVIWAKDQRTVDLPAVADASTRAYCLPIGSIAAVVSETEEEEILSTRRNMLAHTKILEELNRDRPILPFRFGMLATSRESLIAMLRAREIELCRALEEFRDAIEVGIKVSFVDTEIFKEIVAENPELRRQSEDLKNKPPAQTYYERIELGRQVDRRMGAKKAAVAAMLGTRLDGFAVKAVHHATTDDMLVFNASYLIRRADEPALFAAIEKLEAEMQGRLTIRYVAPAPPYNFVSMKLDAVPLAA